jgi:hypothetical protein
MRAEACIDGIALEGWRILDVVREHLKMILIAQGTLDLRRTRCCYHNK